jgi:dipeptidyl-peptidase-4
MIPVRRGRTVWVNWDVARYPYFTHANWHKTGGLTITVQTRDQKELLLLRVDPKTGLTVGLLTERDAAWVNLDSSMPRWLEDGSAFLWTSERDGAWRIGITEPKAEPATRNRSTQRGYQGFVHVDFQRVRSISERVTILRRHTCSAWRWTRAHQKC